jgi:hypothetical protein
MSVSRQYHLVSPEDRFPSDRTPRERVPFTRRECKSRGESAMFMRGRHDGPAMSQATKIVVGTVGVSAILAAVLVLGILLG